MTAGAEPRMDDSLWSRPCDVTERYRKYPDLIVTGLLIEASL